MSISKEDIATWTFDPVTLTFIERLICLKQDADNKIHDLLKPRKDRDFEVQMLQAAFYNASLDVVNEVLDFSNQMKIEAESKKELAEEEEG